MTVLNLEKLTRGILIATASLLAVCVGCELRESLYRKMVSTELQVIQTRQQRDSAVIKMNSLMLSRRLEARERPESYEPDSAVDYY